MHTNLISRVHKEEEEEGDLNRVQRKSNNNTREGREDRRRIALLNYTRGEKEGIV